MSIDELKGYAQGLEDGENSDSSKCLDHLLAAIEKLEPEPCITCAAKGQAWLDRTCPPMVYDQGFPTTYGPIPDLT